MHDESEYHQPPKSLWPIFLLGLVILGLFFFATRALLTIPEPQPEEDAARSAERTATYTELQGENEKRLTTYAIVDAATGAVQIPIQQAMELAAAKLNAQAPVPAGPVNPPLPDAPQEDVQVAEPTETDTSDASPESTPESTPEEAAP